MATKLLDVTLTAAALQALAANTYYWIGRDGSLTTVGGGSLSAAAVPPPPASAVVDLSGFVGAQLVVSHDVLTGAAGGKVSLAPIIPDNTRQTNCPIMLNTATTDQALAATAETVAAALMTAPARVGPAALAITFGTVPTGASPTRIAVWGFRAPNAQE